MVGTFACPECGAEVYPRGLAPGRQARCGVCSTLIEVPYFPRAGGVGRRRAAASARWQPWAIGLGAVVAGALVMMLAVRVIEARGLAADRREMAARVDRADQADRDGHPDEALSAFDEILADPKSPALLGDPVLEGVRARRDAVALRRAEARLGQVESEANPTRAIGDCLALLRAADADPALGSLRERIRDQAARRAGAELADATRSSAEGKVDRALDLAARVVAVTPELPSPAGPRLRDEARALAAEILAVRGVLLDPVDGQFRRGNAESYAVEMRPVLADAFRRLGYQLRPSGSSPFLAAWDSASPYRVAIEIKDEFPLPHFSGTPHVATRIDAAVTLRRGEAVLWTSILSAKTRVPPASMTSTEFGRLALSKAPSAEVAERFYRDAREAFRDVVARKLASLPPVAAPAP